MLLKKIISFVTLMVFMVMSVTPTASAQTLSGAVTMLAPGSLVALSQTFIPAHLVGMTIDSQNALKFDFIIHKGDLPLSDDQKKQEYRDLVKYFLAALTIKDEDQWVNLSPYEGNRIISDGFGMTEMGRDLLAQDYILKQLTASLMHPDSEIGKKFWAEVYKRAWEKYGTTDMPVDTFNKVWIVPDKAVVFEKGQSALIVESHLKVMTEQDYLSMQNNSVAREASGTVKPGETAQLSAEVVREIIIPMLEREVNEGKNFANLRQIVSSMILATWYKKALKGSLLGKVYADKAKVKGVDQDPANNQKIWEQYVAAFKKGAFNLIREDFDKYSQETIPRKYFSGGFDRAQGASVKITHEVSTAMAVQDAAQNYDIDAAAVSLDSLNADVGDRVISAEVRRKSIKNLADAAQGVGPPSQGRQFTRRQTIKGILAAVGVGILADSQQFSLSIPLLSDLDEKSPLLNRYVAQEIALAGVDKSKMEEVKDDIMSALAKAGDKYANFWSKTEYSPDELKELWIWLYSQFPSTVFDSRKARVRQAAVCALDKLDAPIAFTVETLRAESSADVRFELLNFMVKDKYSSQAAEAVSFILEKVGENRNLIKMIKENHQALFDRSVEMALVDAFKKMRSNGEKREIAYILSTLYESKEMRDVLLPFVVHSGSLAVRSNYHLRTQAVILGAIGSRWTFRTVGAGLFTDLEKSGQVVGIVKDLLRRLENDNTLSGDKTTFHNIIRSCNPFMWNREIVQRLKRMARSDRFSRYKYMFLEAFSQLEAVPHASDADVNEFYIEILSKADENDLHKRAVLDWVRYIKRKYPNPIEHPPEYANLPKTVIRSLFNLIEKDRFSIDVNDISYIFSLTDNMNVLAPMVSGWFENPDFPRTNIEVILRRLNTGFFRQRWEEIKGYSDYHKPLQSLINYLENNPKIKRGQEILGLLRRCSALGIDSPFRFERKTLEQLLSFRESPTPGHDDYFMIIATKTDWNGAFGDSKAIPAILNNGKKILYFEAGSREDIKNALLFAAKHGVKVSHMIFSAHSGQQSMNFGKEALFNNDYHLTTKDKDIFVDGKLSDILTSEVGIIIEGCSTGEGKEGADNVVNFFKSIIKEIRGDKTKVRIWGPTKPSGLTKIEFRDGKVVDVSYADENVKYSTSAELMPINLQESGDPGRGLFLDRESGNYVLQIHAGVSLLTMDAAQVSVMSAKTIPGGIDLNNANFDMLIRREGNGVPLPVSQQDLEMININGLTPTILNIQPMMNLPMLNETGVSR